MCGESLWTELFSTTNTLFCVVALVESVLQVIVCHNTTDSFLPAWFWFFLSPVLLLIKGFSPTRRRETEVVSKSGDGARGGRVLKRRASASEKPKPPDTSHHYNKFDSVASTLTRRES